MVNELGPVDSECSPMLGKVGPPVDHHSTHLPITRAAQHEREVEQGKLVAVADTLAKLKNVKSVQIYLQVGWGLAWVDTIVVWVWHARQGEQAKGSLMGKQVSEHGQPILQGQSEFGLQTPKVVLLHIVANNIVFTWPSRALCTSTRRPSTCSLFPAI